MTAFFDDDEDTIPNGGFETPTTIPRCIDCGTVVFFDDFTEPASIIASGIFSGDRCVRARDGHWRWCSEKRMLTYFVPK